MKHINYRLIPLCLLVIVSGLFLGVTINSCMNDISETHKKINKETCEEYASLVSHEVIFKGRIGCMEFVNDYWRKVDL